MNIELKEEKDLGAIIKIVGVGGAGGNALNNMVDKGVTGVEFIAANTDYQDLKSSKASIKLQLGLNLTRGRGSGADPKIGEKAAYEDKEKIEDMLEGSDMIFVTAGMGGGTGTGAAPVIAKIAKEKKIVVVAIVTMPFKFEGSPRRKRAEIGIEKLKESSDALIVISNDKLATMLGNKINLLDAFKEADNVLHLAVSGILDIIDKNGFINRDFNDVKNVLADAGEVVMGTGTMSGEDRVIKAAEIAINNPLVETTRLIGEKKVLVQMNFPENTLLDEFNEATDYFHERFGTDTEILFGLSFSKELTDDVRVTVIAASSKTVSNPDDTTEDTRSKTYIDVYDNPRERSRDIGSSVGFNEMTGTESDISYKVNAKNIDDPEKPAYFRKYRNEFEQ